MSFSSRVLLGLLLGVATGLFLGELVAPLGVAADVFVRLLQMSVLPYVTLSIISNLGRLTLADARGIGLRVAAAIGVLGLVAMGFAFAVALAFPTIEAASFFSPSLAEPPPAPDLVDLYVPANPFHALANAVVPAVVLFSILVGIALIGVERKEPLLDVLRAATDAVGRVARFVVRLSPYGIFAIAAHAAGTLDLGGLARVQVYLISYAAFAVLLALVVLPALVSALTPVGAREMLGETRDAVLTAFLVGDLFIVLPALMEACSGMIRRRVGEQAADRNLPGTIVPVSFTFPHSGKLLSLSFVMFAAWFTDTPLAVSDLPGLAVTGYLSFFGSLNVAVPFLLDLVRVPADTFDLFLATGVLNSRWGTLLAAVHTVAVCLIGSAAVAGAIRVRPGRLVRLAVLVSVLSAGLIVGLRVGFSRFLDLSPDGRAVVYGMEPMIYAPDRVVLSPEDVPRASIPAPDAILEGIRARGSLRVGIIGDGIPYAFRNRDDDLVGFDVEMAHRLADDLGVEVEFVRFPQEELSEQVAARRVDIVMTGARVTPERAADFTVAVPYLDETLAVLTVDHRREQCRSWDAIRAMGPIRVAVQNLPYYLGTVRALLPEARLEVIPETKELIDPAAGYEIYLLPAERGSVLTMLNPRFTVIIPEGRTVRMPLAYPIAGDDPAWVRYVNTWIGLKQRDGFIDALYDHWILGEAAERDEPRWSILRNVLRPEGADGS
ncbi:MAG TPA: cation:dicarboxylase symporter family transporter [bacterium]|nr:cation:dicarboxylase symporter family transporter [bacterium]